MDIHTYRNVTMMYRLEFLKQRTQSASFRPLLKNTLARKLYIFKGIYWTFFFGSEVRPRKMEHMDHISQKIFLHTATLTPTPPHTRLHPLKTKPWSLVIYIKCICRGIIYTYTDLHRIKKAVCVCAPIHPPPPLNPLFRPCH